MSNWRWVVVFVIRSITHVYFEQRDGERERESTRFENEQNVLLSCLSACLPDCLYKMCNCVKLLFKKEKECVGEWQNAVGYMIHCAKQSMRHIAHAQPILPIAFQLYQKWITTKTKKKQKKTWTKRVKCEYLLLLLLFYYYTTYIILIAVHIHC